VGVVGLAVLTTATTVLSLSGPRPAVATGQAAGEATDIRRLYLSDCSVCHGADGRGSGRGPSLVGVGRASLDYQLSTGRMPLGPVGRSEKPGNPLQPLPNRVLPDPGEQSKRHRPAYPEATIAALVDFADRLTGGGGPDIPRLGAGDLAEGGDLFRLQCAACHAWAGDGGALLHREAPELHDATSNQIGEAVRVGPGLMPAFGHAAIDNRQLDQLAAYVRYLADPQDRGGNPLWHLGPFAEGLIAWIIGMVFLILTIRWIGERK
jgi:ubiquinol-cytochrome c reductase cytochrome c subunit